jgi:phytoene synthase
MAVRVFRNRRPRLLAPSRILRPPVRQIGGGRDREELVAEARASIRRGRPSYAFATRLFDRTTRERAWMLYAWYRRCADLVDGHESNGSEREAEQAEQRITAIRILTQRALDGQPTADPAFDGLGQVALEAGLTAEMADDVIGGIELDAAGWQPHGEDDLMRYCYLTGGALAVMMARIMGAEEDDAEVLDRACDLGLALQLFGLARDVSDDDCAGRCFLPLDWLAEADIPPGEHMKPAHREKLVMLVGRVLDLAEEHEAAGRRGLVDLPLRQRWAVLSALNVALATGEELRRRGAGAWDHRLRPSRLGALFKGFMEALDAPLPVSQWPRHTRGALLIAVRMDGPIAPIPMTPLPDEGVQ